MLNKIVQNFLVVAEYIPWVIYNYLYHRPMRDTFTHGWAVYVLTHATFGQVFHTVSIWMTVILAVCRYITVVHSQRNNEWCSFKRVLIAIIGGYVICPIICIPFYMTLYVAPSYELLGADGNKFNATGYNETDLPDNVTNTTMYSVGITENGVVLNFLLYSVVIKLLPCMALVFFSWKLICVLFEAKNRGRTLASATLVRTDDSSGVEQQNGRKCVRSGRLLDKERQTDRTTMMLVAVLGLFLITELPQGVLALLSSILGKSFFNTCYHHMGERFL